MYENAGTAVQNRVPKPPTDQVSAVNNGTIAMLEACVRSADHLIAKTLGPRPEDTGKCEPLLSPCLMSDARRANELARQIQSRLEELHQHIGHDKLG